MGTGNEYGGLYMNDCIDNDDNVTSEGNSQHLSNGDGYGNSGSEPQKEMRRSSRQRQIPMKFNDFVINSNV
ncbi:hypothetical protein Tco_1497379, partial [Tanacetum coccineum]